MNPINIRFKEVVDKKTLGNKSEFQRVMGFGSSEKIRTYYTGEKIPSSQVLLRTLEAFPDISAEWLLRGKGEMIIEGKYDAIIKETQFTPEHAAKIDELWKLKDEVLAVKKEESSK